MAGDPPRGLPTSLSINQRSGDHSYDPRSDALGMPPPPPLHRSQTEFSYQDSGNPFNDPYGSVDDFNHPNSMRTVSTTTPGMDNIGTGAVGGGIAGIALGVAGTNERESGLQAARAIHGNGSYDTLGTDTPYIPEPPNRPRALQQSSSYSSNMPLPPAAVASGYNTPSSYQNGQDVPFRDFPSASNNNPRSEYADSPYKRYSSPWDSRFDQNSFHPDEIEDDGDDGITHGTKAKSMLSSSKRSSGPSTEGSTAGGMMGGIGGMMGRKHRLTPSGNYGPVPATDYGSGGSTEKSQWLAAAESRRRKKRLLFIALGLIAALGIVAGAIVGGILGSKKQVTTTVSNGGAPTAAQDDGSGDLNSSSDEIKKLLNNPNLHKVFPGMDYTPFNAQYPACITNPPSQNNVTRDMAVLSQLTNTIRLYGTDCNQTDMVLHSIDKLGLKDMKVWLGVWLDTNSTTNDRGMSAMYDILDRNGADPFKGVIIGNEVLFRKDLTVAQLAANVTSVRSNFTSKKIDLPIAVADLGDNWKAGALTDSVDVVMSNIHPFFAGVTADQGAGWTWDFWQQFDVVLTKGTSKKNIISEVGWPSAGGNDCGQGTCTSKTDGSVAGIDEMNTFMDSFICQSLKNGTDYFW